MGEEEKPKDEPSSGPVEKTEPPPPPPPQEIVLKVYMHCEGCARKVRKCLAGFDGVEEVTTDCRTSRVVVKGEKADPLKVFERVQKKSHRQVVLVSPIPEPKKEEKPAVVEEKPPPPEEKKEEPQVMNVVLKVHMHCEACAMEIKKRILRMKGVETVEADLKSSEVAVKGAFDPKNLVDYVHKRTGKQAVIVKQEAEKKEEKEKEKEEKKPENEEKKPDSEEKKEQKKPEEKEKKVEEGEVKDEKKEEETPKPAEAPAAAVEEAETSTVEMKKKEYYYPPVELMYFTYPPPQIFSDENPNACTVM